MCGEDGAQREVYKLKEEPEKGVSEEEKKKGRRKKQSERREKKGRRENGIVFERKIFVRPTQNPKRV